MIHYSKKYNVPWFIPLNYHHRQIYKYWQFPRYRGNIKKLPVFDRASSDETWGYCDLPFYPNGVKLRGFWQSWKYLDPVKDDVLKAWNFKAYDELKDFVSIHIRRTDYVTHSDYFPPVTTEYVKKAIQDLHCISGKRHEKFLVFSDDIAWCKQEFAKTFPNRVFVFSPGIKEQPQGGKNEYEQLSLMSSCAHNIIANSSFSYCAAYANRNPEKIVISPSWKEWFGHKSKISAHDLLPPEWHQLSLCEKAIA